VANGLCLMTRRITELSLIGTFTHAY